MTPREAFTTAIHDLALDYRRRGVASTALSASLIQVAAALVLADGINDAEVFACGARIAFAAVRDAIAKGGPQA